MKRREVNSKGEKERYTYLNAEFQRIAKREIPGVTGKFGLGVQNEAGQKLTVLSKEHTGHSKHPLPTTQETTLHRIITRWSD